MDAEEFDSTEFEQRLTSLKDTQDSIQSMSACLKNRTHHKKIVSSWLSVLKQVKVEHRLTLFHLANDVIQHSKRKNYEFVDSWGTTLQKATTMVRDEKVKNKIIRIFNIWDQRAVYNEEFLTDLHNLISINPINQKQQQAELDDEQKASIIADHIRSCVRTEKETDKCFKTLYKTPLCDTENIHILKDRKHVEDVKREIDDHMHKLENYIRSLHAEIKERKSLIFVLEQADAFYHNQRGEVKVVANAYRNFFNRIKTMKRKAEECCAKLPSPIPSPDINAPSPEPDTDFDLLELSQNLLNKSNNGFLSFADSGNLSFNINDFKSESPKTDAQPIQVIGSSSVSKDLNDFNVDDFFKSMMPDSYSSSLPQPVPPVSNNYSLPSVYGDGPRYTAPQQNVCYRPPPPQSDYRPPMPPNNPYNASPARPSPNNHYGGPPKNQNFNPSFNPPMSSYSHPQRPRYPLNQSNFNNHMPLVPPPVPPIFDGNLNDEYNPENWDVDTSWNTSQTNSFNQSIETPVSPPHFEREERPETVVEYIDHGQRSDTINATSDVDHRQLRLPKAPANLLNQENVRSLDIDHRNLISLTGSPPTRKTENESPSVLQIPNLWKGDMDFRKIKQIIESLTKDGTFSVLDSDYRVIPNIQNQTFTTQQQPKPNADSTITLSPQPQHQMDPTPPKAVERSTTSTDNNKPATSSTILHEFTSPPSRLGPSKSNTKVVRKSQNGNDNVESIDIEMSDEDFEDFLKSHPFEEEDLEKKNDEGSSNVDEVNEISNDNTSNQSSNRIVDQSQDQLNIKSGDSDSASHQSGKEPMSPLQFRPVNMFNSAPPGFVRPPPGPPPLLNPNFFHLQIDFVVIQQV